MSRRPISAFVTALARSRFAAVVRPVVDRLAGDRLRVVRVRSGVARGARLELDLTREKAYWLGHYEPEVQGLLARLVRPGDLVYDVGGHLGFFSVCAALLGASVVVFEPSPGNARRLRRNVELNGLSIDVVEVAVWDSVEGAELVAGASDSEWWVTAGSGVPTVALDGFSAGRGDRPSLLKVDVEGAEVRVLAGAARLIAEIRPAIVCELHSAEARDAIEALLPGYSFEPVGHDWRILALPPPA